MQPMLSACLPVSVDTAADDMREARERANVAVTVHLRSRVNSRHEFWLTTYHM